MVTQMGGFNSLILGGGQKGLQVLEQQEAEWKVLHRLEEGPNEFVTLKVQGLTRVGP